MNGGSEDLDVTSVGVDEDRGDRHRHRASHRARPRAHRLRRRRRVRAPDAREDAGAPGRIRAARLQDGLVAHSTFTSAAGARRCASCSRGGASAPDRRHLLERPHGDRCAAGSLRTRPAGSVTSRSWASTGSTRPSWTNPPLTTVEQPIDEIARTAVEALRGQVERPFERQPSYVFRPRLRLGGTTAPPSSAAATS